MKKLVTIVSLLLLSALTACQKDDLVSREQEEIKPSSGKGIRVDEVRFDISTEPFEFINIDEPVTKSYELRSTPSNSIRLTNKDNDKAPFVSIASEDMIANLYVRVVGAGDQYKFDFSKDKENQKPTGFEITTNPDGSQRLAINWYQADNSAWYFKENQYLAMFFNGHIWSTQNIYERANENLCLVKNGQINRREIPLLTDLKKAILSKKDTSWFAHCDETD